jgi:hypothetical protein
MLVVHYNLYMTKIILVYVLSLFSLLCRACLPKPVCMFVLSSSNVCARVSTRYLRHFSVFSVDSAIVNCPARCASTANVVYGDFDIFKTKKKFKRLLKFYCNCNLQCCIFTWLLGDYLHNER